jgi:methyl-accepting chemotaxis protein
MRSIRLKFLTYRKVQLRLVGIVLVCLLLFMGFFSVVYMNAVANAPGRTKEVVVQDQLITQMLLVEQTRDLAVIYGFAAFIFILLICFYLIVYSNRLTGPIFKLTRIIETSVTQGELPKPVRFRKDDAFKELAEAFNKFLETVEKKK